MNFMKLRDGEKIPNFGIGTWRMGENNFSRTQEVNAIKYAYEQGIRLIDTAEMYGSGGAEEVIAEAVGDKRDELFIVSKVFPQNATRGRMTISCENSLNRLQTDRIDLYLLHWPGNSKFPEAVECFETLKSEGKIRHWGVSNFDTADMAELADIAGGEACTVNQVLYHLAERGPETDLLPYCQLNSIPIMAYTPLGGPAVLRERTVIQIAQKHGCAPAAIALAWILRNQGVMVIPKAAQLTHIDEILVAQNLVLDGEDYAALETAFSVPDNKSGLASAQGSHRRF